MAFEAYFDSPSLYQHKFDFYSCGSSPKLTTHLLQYLDANAATLAEIHISLYLFNNNLINEKLVALAAAGILVSMYTIPIEGYDAGNAKNIIDIATRKITSCSTKYGLAKEIFSAHYNKLHKNYTLSFLPHMYLRSANVKTFSRGNMPYSLHTKSFLFKHKDGRCDFAISSSNFAVRDLVKEENLLFGFSEASYQQAIIDFFAALKNIAINIADYNFAADYGSFNVVPVKYAFNKAGGFMAPFYYNASLHIEDHLAQLISQATTRIIIVGQHICPISYTINSMHHHGLAGENNERPGLTGILVQKAAAGVPVQILSQTFIHHTAGAKGSGRMPVNKASFTAFFKQIASVPGIEYFVNENCHSKFMVIDDAVFVSTFNYTPTQFIYCNKVQISNFVNNAGKTYKGIYAEVGQFILIDAVETVNRYVENFTEIKLQKETVKVK